MAQSDAEAPNVMRGEETQLAGIGESHADGLVCMPGTHCKWVRLEGEDGAPHLSGVLIGSEVAAARERYGAGPVSLVASQRLVMLYSSIMEQAGFTVSLVDGERAVRVGLLAAARHLHPVMEA
jgi:2-keto-3-deoxy-galactonokinase